MGIVDCVIGFLVLFLKIYDEVSNHQFFGGCNLIFELRNDCMFCTFMERLWHKHAGIIYIGFPLMYMV